MSQVTIKLPSQEMISDAWVSGTSYSIGDLVIHSNLLWKCTVATSSEEPSSSAACWEQTTLDAEISSVFPNYSNMTEVTALQTDATNYTVPSNGWLLYRVQVKEKLECAFSLIVNGDYIAFVYYGSAHASWQIHQGIVPVRKGTVVTSIFYNLNINSVKFIPA